MIIVGAGILGLSVAEAASRSGICVDVLDAPHASGASWAAAAQLGMKGQALSKSGVFATKLGGQRCYETWLERWDGLDPKPWFRRGWGRDRVLNDAECAEQIRRVAKHERDAGTVFHGPGLAFCSQNQREILYLQEACVDAPVLLSRLRSALEARGVRFWRGDACDKETMRRLIREKLADRATNQDCPGTELRSIVLAAGAWSFEVLQAWGGFADLQLDFSAVRYSLGGTLVLQPGEIEKTGPSAILPDFKRFVIEGVIDRSQREIAVLTEHLGDLGKEQRLTSLNFSNTQGAMFKRYDLDNLSRASQATEIGRMRGLLQRHSLAIDKSPSQWSQNLRCGIRMRACSRDIVLEAFAPPRELAASCYDAGFSRMQKLPQVILFTGANRSGYVYGPFLANRVVELDAH